MQKVKNNKVIKFILIMIPAMALLLLCAVSFLPSMGMKVLQHNVLKNGAFVFLGISFIITGINVLRSVSQANDNYGRPRQETLEELYEKRGDHRDLRGIIALVGGIIILIWSMTHVISGIEDAQNGPVRITLESTQIGDMEKVEAGVSVSSYYLYGTANQEVFKFRIDAEEADVNLMRRINYLSPEVVVIFYPKTKAIVQMQIFFEEDEKIVLPYGERAYDSRSMEKLPEAMGEGLEEAEYKEYVQKSSTPIPASTPKVYVPMKQEYSKVDIEDLELPEFAIGDNYKEVSRELMALPDGENYQSSLLSAVLYDEHFQKLKGIITEYEISIEQSCDILYKDDIELIFIFDKETYVIEDFFARRYLNYNK